MFTLKNTKKIIVIFHALMRICIPTATAVFIKINTLYFFIHCRHVLNNLSNCLRLFVTIKYDTIFVALFMINFRIPAIDNLWSDVCLMLACPSLRFIF